jgi:poly-gamma-glutamate synthase PgsB/CapB
VTRLIAGGLRAGGLRTLGKTTGTHPRLIFEDGSEEEIWRVGKANIREQLAIIRRAARRGVDALVVECMAVHTELQFISEQRMVQSTVGVITNARPDHLDEMGGTVESVAQSLAGTIPRNGPLFTCESRHIDIFRRAAESLGARVEPVEPASVSDEEMEGFGHLEWKENVALALAVCDHLGIDRNTALAGMKAADPDPGVVQAHHVHFFNKDIKFINAFAVNDPDSIELIWDRVGVERDPSHQTIVILNCRADRIERSKQMSELIATRIAADHYILTGELTKATLDHAISFGLSQSLIEDMGGESVEDVFERVTFLTRERSTVVAIGNIVGFGEKIAQFFANRGEPIGY